MHTDAVSGERERLNHVVTQCGQGKASHGAGGAAVCGRFPLRVVARNLGHADTRMVERHYGHLAPSFITEAIHAGAPRYGIKAPKRVVPLR